MDRSFLSQPEGPDLEFKARRSSPENLSKTLIAFANGRGGRIVFGVDDRTRSPLDLSEDELIDLEQWVANVAHDRCKPAIRPYAMVESCDGKRLLVITVYPGMDKPYHLKGLAPGEGTYVRIGSSNRLADPAMLRELERQARNVTFDETLVYDRDETAIDPDVLARYLAVREQRRGLPVETVDLTLKEKLRAVAREHGRTHPTVGGLLLYSLHPDELFPQSTIRCARFKGRTPDVFIDQQDLTGPILDLIEGAMKFVQRNIRLGARVEGLYRQEKYEYPLEAVREVVVNAVAHRDYSLRGSSVRLAIYDDCIEVTSPGLLPPPLSLEQLGTGASAVRNRVIARNLKEMALFEEWGRGTRLIRERMSEWRLPPPKFEEVGMEFRVTLWGPESDLASPIAAARSAGRAEAILELARRNAEITARAVADHLGVSKVTANKELQALVDQGHLARIGRGRNTVYRLS